MKKINLGVIGAGRIGKVHVETLMQNIPQATVTIIADVDVDEACKLAERFGIKNVSADYMEVVNNKDVDAVIICSPTNTHVQYIIDAANAGKHIFCEKPVDISPVEIKKALDAVEKAGVMLMVGFNRRFDPNFMKVRHMVDEGKVGDVHIVKITSRDPAPPPAEYSAVSGGMFMDMTIHDFDMARYITNSEVKEVFVKAGVRIDKAIGEAGDVDTAIITLEFESGAFCVIDNSRKAVYGYDQRLEVFGSAGMVSVDNNFPETHKFYSANGVHRSLPLNFFMERYTESYANEMRLFCEAIANGTALPVNGNDGLAAVLVALAARKSFEEDRPVKLDEIK
ncbi:MAG: inositol 2-dehydrogenase [Prolixibacteraceae bacterium]|jgi:myo-inositol 2-dehydrogenase/D-chiro-inositol 1-dehydrogenase|nr:inositol 2-dehydrogenase [Prolixibacteraceae bacterium]